VSSLNDIYRAADNFRLKAAYLDKIAELWEDKKLQDALASDGIYDIMHYTSPDEIFGMFHNGNSRTKKYLDSLNK
jgi:hypothetical protein